MSRKISLPLFCVICSVISAIGVSRFSHAENALWETPWVSSALPPSAGQGIVGESFMDGTQNIIDAAFLADGLHLRRLAAGDGTVRWDVLDNDSWTKTQLNGLSIITTTDTVLATAAISGGVFPYSSGIWVAAFDRSTASKRWLTYYPATSGAQPLWANLHADGAGNFFFTASGISPCCARGGQSIIKLASTDGSIIWRRDSNATNNNLQVFPPATAFVGADIVAQGPFESTSVISKLVRLSGADGSTIWSASAFAPNGITTAHDGNLVTFLGDGAGFAKINAADGSLLWIESSDDGCNGNCTYNSFRELPNGDFLRAGYISDPLNDYLDTPWLFRVRGDGSGVAYSGNPTPSNPSIVDDVIQTIPSADGNVWMRILHYTNSYHILTWLSKFDVATNTVISNQVVGLEPLADSQTFASYVDMLAAPSTSRLLLRRIDYKPNASPATVDALIDSSITAHGDLDVVVTSPKVIPHGGVAHIVMTVHYTGDVPITGVKLFGVLPLPLSGNLGCTTQSASNCTTDISSGHLHASFDLLPGGQVTVSVDLLGVNSESQMSVEAILYGPMSLSESTIKNNFATAPIAETLFASDFE